jgi:hypothetical protein
MVGPGFTLGVGTSCLTLSLTFVTRQYDLTHVEYRFGAGKRAGAL